TDEEVEMVVVGYPRKLDNTASEALIYVNPFVKKLKKEFPQMGIELIDERFTSKMAFQSMIQGGVKKEKRKDKGLIDKVSATIILQSYLESQSGFNNNF
ncbi:MAG: Holliday junction resolvase RuvX, partial [Marinilabiliales bacterium]